MLSFTRILQLKFFTEFAQNLIVNNVEFYLKNMHMLSSKKWAFCYNSLKKISYLDT